MGEIKKIAISGFRGINTPPLELDFQKGKSARSMMIYGRNGSGKSSIVDAWEWLYSEKIEHLAKEGAGPQSYPHKEAERGQTYIEVEFTDNEIGKIRLEYNPNRITIPKIEGDLSKLKERVPHPCHLRYRDLTEFVYARKARKYEILSMLMGFQNALNIQNDLQTCAGRLENEVTNLQKEKERVIREYEEISGEEPKDTVSFIRVINSILERQGISPVNASTEVGARLGELKEMVEEDKISQKLLLWEEIKGIINKFYPLEDIRLNVSKFHTDLIKFKENEEEIKKVVLLDLYEKGIEAIESLEIYDNCPLCDQPYEGDLIAYIRGKQDNLAELNKRKSELDNKRSELLSSIKDIIKKIDTATSNLEGKELVPQVKQFKENLIRVKPLLKECKDELEKRLENIDKEFDFNIKIDTKEYKFLLDSESKLKEEISDEIDALEQDKLRKSLVDDFQRINKLRECFLNWQRINKKIEKLEEIKRAFGEIKNDYIQETKWSVQTSFDLISLDVVKYFEILERDNENIADPKIKLISERDKAVELEIVFGGDAISPAYKVLSESQINSFGLSIFLASIKNFNTNFKFIILDDVINSFDAYKRPRVIDLLKEYFSDYQILLLTHDEVWLDRLQRSFPQWIRRRFIGWDYAIGPRTEPGKNNYEQIEEFLSKDEPTDAGRRFGVYLEWILQLLCENLEASVKYRRQNYYTLAELYQAFRDRMKKKLKQGHPVVRSILEFEEDTGFRNFSMHWKNPTIPYTSSEIRDIVEKWKEIETKIECGKCHNFIKYIKVNGYEHISCPCGKLNLND